MKSNPMCLTVLLVTLIGQAGTIQASDLADQAGVVPKRDASAYILTSGEIDSSKVEVGAYVEVTYYKGEKLDTVRGYIKAVDSETLTIGRGLWQEQIAFERIQKLRRTENQAVDWFSRIVLDTLSVNEKNNRGLGLIFEVGRNQGIDTSDNPQVGLPWGLSLYFRSIMSRENKRRFGVKFTHQAVEGDKTYRSSSLLSSYQHVVKRTKRGILLTDMALGITFIDDSSNAEWCDLEMGGRFSGGLTFLLPIHKYVGVQATVRVDVLSFSPEESYPFTSREMSAVFGLHFQQ